MADSREYRFQIDVFTPETLPMARLAEYMYDLARMLGESEGVHFVRLDPGSAVLVHKVDAPAAPKVSERLSAVQRRDAAPEAMEAYERLDSRLRKDNSVGHLYDDGAEIIRFPGREAIQDSFGPLYQNGTLDGRVVRLGGVSDEPRVAVSNRGKTHNCVANRDVVRQLGQYIYGPEIRFYGRGRWMRGASGAWRMERFRIHHFDVLDQEALTSLVARLRDIPGSDWPQVKDPWGELARIRNGEPGPE